MSNEPDYVKIDTEEFINETLVQDKSTELYFDWIEFAADRVALLSLFDPISTHIDQRMQETEPDYLNVMEKLSPQDREKIERYLNYCEEEDARLSELSYYYGQVRRTIDPEKVPKLPFDFPDDSDSCEE